MRLSYGSIRERVRVRLGLSRTEDRALLQRWYSGPGAPLTDEDAERLQRASAEGKFGRRVLRKEV